MVPTNKTLHNNKKLQADTQADTSFPTSNYCPSKVY